jgi:hypothetical protein
VDFSKGGEEKMKAVDCLIDAVGCQARDDQAPSPRRRIRWTDCGRAKKKGVSYLKVLSQSARPGRLPIEGTDTVIGEPRLQMTFSEPHGSVFISAPQTSEQGGA